MTHQIFEATAPFRGKILSRILFNFSADVTLILNELSTRPHQFSKTCSIPVLYATSEGLHLRVVDTNFSGLDEVIPNMFQCSRPTCTS